MRRLVLVFSLLTVVGGAFAQTRARIATVPLNFTSVSKAEATALTDLLETALVKTEMFDVIAQSARDEILEAQETSVSDCTDEACAVQIGKLLAAAQIVIGSVTRLGSTYIVNAKIVDVANARTLVAEKVEATTLEELAKQMELLGFKLAGLTYQEGSADRVATDFGELYVQTTPDGADVYLNGVSRGQSPLLLKRVPAGRVRIEARKQGLYALSELSVEPKKTARLSLELKTTLGNLFVRSSEKQVDVFFDGKDMGKLGDGFYADVPVGKIQVELKGDGLYWQGEAVVEEAETTEIQGYPRGIGSLRYEIPEGAEAELVSTDTRQVVRGSGTLERLWEGTYQVTVQGETYQPLSQQIRITRKETTDLRLRPERTREYLEQQEVAARQKDYARYAQGVEEAEERATSSAEVTEVMVAESSRLLDELRQSTRQFPDLATRLTTAVTKLKQLQEMQEAERAHAEARRDIERQIAALESERAQVQQQLTSTQARKRARAASGITFLILAVVAGGGSGLSFWQAQTSYERYQAATITDVATQEREAVLRWSTVGVGSAGAGGGCLVLSGLSFLLMPRAGAGQERLADLDEQILLLKAKL